MDVPPFWKAKFTERNSKKLRDSICTENAYIKEHRQKNYLHKLNRKQINRKQTSTGDIPCDIIKEAWNHKKSYIRNLRDMGLATDPNKVIKIPNFKQDQIKKAFRMVNDNISGEEEEVVRQPLKNEVAEQLEQNAKASKKRKFM